MGYKYIDYNGRYKVGVSYIQARTKSGLRISAEKGYLREAKGRENLFIWPNCYVTKLLYHDGEPCVKGVEFMFNNKLHEITAKKEVLVTAGSYNSPTLLLRSGIGPARDLKRLGIEVIKDLPVGRYLRNHIMHLGKYLNLIFKSIKSKLIFMF